MTTSMTTDRQLYKLANKIGITLEPIIFKDELKYMPSPKKKYTNYIINLSNSNELGSHWTALFIHREGASIATNKVIKHTEHLSAYYFNSFSSLFGDLPQEVKEFLQKENIFYVMDNAKPIQNPYRGFCGQFSMDFLLHMNNPNYSSEENYNRFLNDYESALPIILQYYNNKIRRNVLAF